MKKKEVSLTLEQVQARLSGKTGVELGNAISELKKASLMVEALNYLNQQERLARTTTRIQDMYRFAKPNAEARRSCQARCPEGRRGTGIGANFWFLKYASRKPYHK